MNTIPIQRINRGIARRGRDRRGKGFVLYLGGFLGPIGLGFRKRRIKCEEEGEGEEEEEDDDEGGGGKSESFRFGRQRSFAKKRLPPRFFIMDLFRTNFLNISL